MQYVSKLELLLHEKEGTHNSEDGEVLQGSTEHCDLGATEEEHRPQQEEQPPKCEGRVHRPVISNKSCDMTCDITCANFLFTCICVKEGDQVSEEKEIYQRYSQEGKIHFVVNAIKAYTMESVCYS